MSIFFKMHKILNDFLNLVLRRRESAWKRLVKKFFPAAGGETYILAERMFL